MNAQQRQLQEQKQAAIEAAYQRAGYVYGASLGDKNAAPEGWVPDLSPPPARRRAKSTKKKGK